MERKVVKFVNDTDEDVSFKLHLKNCTGDEFTLKAKHDGITQSVQKTFPCQTHTKYVLYDSTDRDTGRSISSDDLDWEDNTVTVTKVGGNFELGTRRSSSEGTIWDWLIKKFLTPTLPR